MEFTAIVQFYYPQRMDYLEPIFDAIREAKPKEIILWNNTGVSLLQPSDITEIVSDRNTLLGRYAAALLAQTEIAYVQDDDLIVEPGTITRLVEAANDADYATIYGICGTALNVRSHHPYTEGRTATPGHCDVALGRAWACRRAALAPGIAWILENNQSPERCDDIHFSLMAPDGADVIPDPKYTNLDEQGIGLSHQPQHYDERNQWARQMIVNSQP